MWFSPDNLAEDKDLVRAAKLDSEHFLPLYNKYFTPILAYCRKRLPEQHEAEDACADIFLAALKQMKTYKWQGLPYIIWLYKIAANHIAAYYRKHYKHPEVSYDETLENHAADLATASEVVEASMKKNKLEAALSELPDHWQTLLTLKFHLGLSNQDIGKQLGLGEAAVKMHYYRALQKLRQLLQEEPHVVS